MARTPGRHRGNQTVRKDAATRRQRSVRLRQPVREKSDWSPRPGPSLTSSVLIMLHPRDGKLLSLHVYAAGLRFGSRSSCQEVHVHAVKETKPEEVRPVADNHA